MRNRIRDLRLARNTTKDIYTHIRAAKRRRDLESLRSIDFDL